MNTENQPTIKIENNDGLSPSERSDDIWNDNPQEKGYSSMMNYSSRTPSPGFGIESEEFLKNQSGVNGTSSGPGIHGSGIHGNLGSRYYNENEDLIAQMQNLNVRGGHQSLNDGQGIPLGGPQNYYPSNQFPFPTYNTQTPFFGGNQVNFTNPPPQYMQSFPNQNIPSYNNGNRITPNQRPIPFQSNVPNTNSGFEKNVQNSYSIIQNEQVSPTPQIIHSNSNWDRNENTQQNPPQNQNSGTSRTNNRGHARKSKHGTRTKGHVDQTTNTRSKLLEEFKKGTKKFELKDIVGHVVEFSRDQHGSRFIQQKLENASPQEKELIFEEIKPEALSLMTDVFGNYVIQKFFDYGSKKHKKQLANELTGNVLNLTLQTYGCRVIQKALEVIDTDDQKIIGEELKDDVIKCVSDQNGNHVIQKCIEKMSPSRVQFIVDSFCKQIQQQSRHAYGCRVIQRMLEHCTDEQTAPLLDEILGCVTELVSDQYGNYVVQHVVEHGKPEYRSKIIAALKGKFAHYSLDKYASNVVEKSFAFGSAEERDKIISEITSNSTNPDEEDPILAMMNDQFANFVIQKIIKASTDDQRTKLIAGITPHLSSIRSKTFGKHIISCISEFSDQTFKE